MPIRKLMMRSRRTNSEAPSSDGRSTRCGLTACRRRRRRMMRPPLSVSPMSPARTSHPWTLPISTSRSSPTPRHVGIHPAMYTYERRQPTPTQHPPCHVTPCSPYALTCEQTCYIGHCYVGCHLHPHGCHCCGHIRCLATVRTCPPFPLPMCHWLMLAALQNHCLWPRLNAQPLCAGPYVRVHPKTTASARIRVYNYCRGVVNSICCSLSAH